MSDKANLTLTLAGKDGSSFVVDGLQSVYARVQKLRSSDVALLEFTVLIPQYLQVLLGYTAERAGMVLSPAGFVMMLMMAVAGRTLGKGDPRLMVCLGYLATAAGIYNLTRYLLVPDLGPYRERIMAETGSALILGLLAAKLLHNAYSARQQALARLQIIAELNHHVRNALEVISLSAYITRDEEAIRRITEGVNRIDWALREILPRESFPIATGEPPRAADTLTANWPVPAAAATAIPAPTAARRRWQRVSVEEACTYLIRRARSVAGR